MNVTLAEAEEVRNTPGKERRELGTWDTLVSKDRC